MLPAVVGRVCDEYSHLGLMLHTNSIHCDGHHPPVVQPTPPSYQCIVRMRGSQRSCSLSCKLVKLRGGDALVHSSSHLLGNQHLIMGHHVRDRMRKHAQATTNPTSICNRHVIAGSRTPHNDVVFSTVIIKTKNAHPRARLVVTTQSLSEATSMHDILRHVLDRKSWC